MKSIQTMCDMASIKIHTKDVSFFFDNHSGDGFNEVRLLNKTDKPNSKAEFLGHFTVKTKAWLSGYDCDDTKVHEFSEGRYFVWLLPYCIFEIKKEDADIHA